MAQRQARQGGASVEVAPATDDDRRLLDEVLPGYRAVAPWVGSGSMTGDAGGDELARVGG
jgi:hypothetical protein